MRNKLFLFILFLLSISTVLAWTPPSNINLFDYYNITNGSYISATNFLQDGNTVIDNVTTANLSVNFSSFANSSTYWDGETSQADLNVNSSTFWASVSSFVTRWFYDDSNVFSFNESRMNDTIDNISQATNTSMKTYVDAQDTIISLASRVYTDATNIIFNDSMKTYVDSQDTTFNNSMKTYADATFITQADEDNLDVNSSDFWDALDTPLNIVQMDNFLAASINVTNNVTVLGETLSSVFRFINGNNNSYLKLGEDTFTDTNSTIVFANQDANLAAGQIVFLFHTQGNSTTLWAQFGKNNSYGGWGNSFGIIPNYLGIENFSNTTHINMTDLSNYITVCDTFGVDCQYNADTRGRAREKIPGGPLLWTMGDLEVWGSANIIEGAMIHQNLDVLLNGTDMDIIGGSLHIREEVIVELGFEIGDEVQTLHETFEDGELDPFIQETSGGGVNEWTIVSIGVCDNDFCAETTGSGPNPIRTMVANFSTVDMDNCNLTFLLTTVDLDPGDIFNVTVNNNSGSGDILLYNITDGTDVSSTTIVISSISSDIDNISDNSIRFSLQAGNNEDAVVDDIFLHCNATATTTVNLTRFNSEICLGEGIKLANGRCIYDIFWNDTSKVLNLPGNISFDSVTETDVNITASLTISAETITNWDNISLFDDNVLLKDGSRGLTANWAAGAWNITASYFNGLFNWIVGSSGYLSFNGSQLDFNDTFLNQSFQTEIGPGCSGGTPLATGINDDGTMNCTSASAGDITAVRTNDSADYLLGGEESAIVSLSINTTTFDANYWNTADGVSAFVNRSLWTTIDDYPSACAGTTIVRGLGDTLTCVTPDATGQCTGDVCGGGHTHPASEVTTGTFGPGNYVMDANLTVQNLLFETDATNHYINDNATCIIIRGDTSTLEIC